MTLSLSLISLVPVIFVFWWQKNRRLAPLPPGPQRLPIVGNLFNAPKDFAWKTYLEWSQKYGSNILYLNVFGARVVVLNSQEMASELLTKRSSIYSSRPYSYMASRLLDCDWMLACLPYNDSWRVSRRLLAKYFSRSSKGSRTSVAGFTDFEWQRPHVVKYTHYFLRSLLQDPDSFMDHTFQLAASVAISSSYGLDISTGKDQNLALAKAATDALKSALSPGRFWVDTLPILRLAPEWVEFKRLAREWKEDLKRFLVVPFSRAKQNLAYQPDNKQLPSVVSQELRSSENVDHRVLQGACATVFVGAASTTSAALNVFLLVLTSFPEAQKRAQSELDSLLQKRSQKLPTHADFKELPYCTALVYEALRKAIPPAQLKGWSLKSELQGYRIPNGTVVIANVWAMMRDPSIFPDPSEFRPERFLNNVGTLDELEVKKIDPIFGFGRRVCVGRSLALSILAHALCCILTVFDIQKKLDDQGEPIEPRIEFDSCVTSMAVEQFSLAVYELLLLDHAYLEHFVINSMYCWTCVEWYYISDYSLIILDPLDELHQHSFILTAMFFRSLFVIALAAAFFCVGAQAAVTSGLYYIRSKAASTGGYVTYSGFGQNVVLSDQQTPAAHLYIKVFSGNSAGVWTSDKLYSIGKRGSALRLSWTNATSPGSWNFNLIPGADNSYLIVDSITAQQDPFKALIWTATKDRSRNVRNDRTGFSSIEYSPA
ncbi:hypothetical protein NP233_g465 [Leucocoprinus birnbaumii]|uniref:Cytochrome P450 n=1 Tax=Leucocoprinus birnbaumii TaxID=56174 RepID=A0AAD5W407_9AGAR|nr:hypothetical protein NP233_g465 [Leucocoprinus birnbaumii]